MLADVTLCQTTLDDAWALRITPYVRMAPTTHIATWARIIESKEPREAAELLSSIAMLPGSHRLGRGASGGRHPEQQRAGLVANSELGVADGSVAQLLDR